MTVLTLAKVINGKIWKQDSSFSHKKGGLVEGRGFQKRIRTWADILTSGHAKENIVQTQPLARIIVEIHNN